jgi:hypothetical protein
MDDDPLTDPLCSGAWIDRQAVVPCEQVEVTQ